MERETLESAVERVQRMEGYLEEILEAFEADVELLWEPRLQENIQALSAYYSCGLWLEDYDRDERGEFPKDMKRGVLGQDTLYDLFQELEEIGIKI